MLNLTAFSIPGSSNNPQTVDIPSSLPTHLNGGFDTTGVSLIQTGLDFLFIITSVLAAVVILWSGIEIITSGGDSMKMSNARKRLSFAVIGLIIVAIAFAMVSVIINISSGDSAKFLKFN